MVGTTIAKKPNILCSHAVSVHRLVGALERKTGHFQCFTVRQAQPDEQKGVGGQATVCDNALTKIFSMMAEA